MLLRDYTLQYTFPMVRVRFQDRHYYLKAMFYDDEHYYVQLEAERQLSTSSAEYCNIFVRMSDFRTELIQDNNINFCENGQPAPDDLIQFLTLTLDASVAPSKVEGFLLKHGTRLHVRRNWFGSIEFEELPAKEVSKRDHELIDALLLEWENSQDEKFLTQVMDTLVNHTGFQLTLDDFLRKL